MATLANTATANQMAFGQYGSAFLDTDAGILVPPNGMVVVAIQCLGDTEFDILTAEDSDRFINTISASHATAADTVSTGVTAGTFIDMDGDATAEAGDSMYLSSTGAFIAKVKRVGFDSSGSADASAIELDRPCTVTAAAHSFASNTKGGGGLILDTGNVFPEGMTIYGRWTCVSVAADQTSDGVICYFGPAKDPSTTL